MKKITLIIVTIIVANLYAKEAPKQYRSIYEFPNAPKIITINKSDLKSGIQTRDGSLADIHINLNWEENIDLDLHLRHPDDYSYEYYDAPRDCYFGQKKPEWGESGKILDNPWLDYDYIDIPGDENIYAYQLAENGDYKVIIHGFFGSGEAYVTVEYNGDIQHESTKFVSDGELWTPFIIRITDDSSAYSRELEILSPAYYTGSSGNLYIPKAALGGVPPYTWKIRGIKRKAVSETDEHFVIDVSELKDGMYKGKLKVKDSNGNSVKENIFVYKRPDSAEPLILIHGWHGHPNSETDDSESTFGNGAFYFGKLKKKGGQLYDVDQLPFMMRDSQSSVEHAAALLNSRINNKFSGKKCNIICHSMGGMVLREYIRQNSDASDKINKIIFASSSHYGCEFSTGFDPVLTPDSQLVFNLYTDWSQFDNDNSIYDIPKDNILNLIGANDAVVLPCRANLSNLNGIKNLFLEYGHTGDDDGAGAGIAFIKNQRHKLFKIGRKFIEKGRISRSVEKKSDKLKTKEKYRGQIIVSSGGQRTYSDPVTQGKYGESFTVTIFGKEYEGKYGMTTYYVE